MNQQDRYRCPNCSFRIFNRRVSKCESCGAALPADLLFTAKQIAEIDAGHEKQSRETRALREQANAGDAGSGIGGWPWDGGIGIDGGGD